MEGMVKIILDEYEITVDKSTANYLESGALFIEQKYIFHLNLN